MVLGVLKLARECYADGYKIHPPYPPLALLFSPDNDGVSIVSFTPIMHIPPCDTPFAYHTCLRHSVSKDIVIVLEEEASATCHQRLKGKTSELLAKGSYFDQEIEDKDQQED